MNEHKAKEVLIIEPKYKPSILYRVGLFLIKDITSAFHIDVDWQPLALPADRVTGKVECPNCWNDVLMTVSMFNKQDKTCPHCGHILHTMNNSEMIWLVVPERHVYYWKAK